MAAAKSSKSRLLFGFLAGFLATLAFHQVVLALLWLAGVAANAPYSMAATRPFGIPAVFSLSFWGGVWGMVFAWLAPRFPRRAGYWAAAFLFGAIVPSLVALPVVLPLKGRPMGGGWRPTFLATVFLVNGAWGLGTGIILRGLSQR